MTTDVQRQRLTIRPHKTLANAGLLSAVLAIQMLAGTAMAGGSYEPPKRSRLAPLINEDVPNRIPDQYIVIFKPGTSIDVALAAQKKVIGLRGTIRTRYTSGLIGFSAELSENALQALRANPSVDYIEVNQEGWLNSSQPPDPMDTPPTGLDRTSERGLVNAIPPQPRIDKKYTYSEMGTGVHVYVIDTGIRADHTDFGGRVSGGKNVAINDGNDNNGNEDAVDTEDCDGHGTHVAGIIGGWKYGIAKNVTLHPIRANGTGILNPGGSSPGCGLTKLDLVIKAVKWITKRKQENKLLLPAVVNLSSTFALTTTPGSTQSNLDTLKTEVETSINAGITYVIAAGNHNRNACPGTDSTRVESPANVSTAITVGAIDPNSDALWVDGQKGSNFGNCLDVFAPGKDILSAAKGSPTDFKPESGTSQAAAHVTGVVARILSRSAPNTPLASPRTPDKIWNALHCANNIKNTQLPPIPPYGNCPMNPPPETMGWAGVQGIGTTSPNEMLHYGWVSDGTSDGDTHITTVNGIHYDFQAAGEFVALRDANGMEIQTRQTSVPSAPSVSVNTAIAARVGQHRVSWQPNISGVPDPSGLQLRVDSVVTAISENGLDLGYGGRIMKSAAGDGIEIHFPDGTALLATATWWAGQNQWYLNVHVFHTPAKEGIMGTIEPDSWSQPEFAATWGVTNETSLFDYAPGLSTNTFAISSVPQDQIPPINSEVLALAQRVCESMVDPALADLNRLADCAFDIAVTRDPIFAKSHRLAQRIQQGATTTTVMVERDLRRIREEVTLITAVTRHGSVKSIPTGRVMFLLDGKELGKPVTLDAKGQAQWKMSSHRVDGHRVTTKYIPDEDSVFLPSNSLDKTLAVEKKQIPHGGAGSKKLNRK
jgi:subtilisin family serine protease